MIQKKTIKKEQGYISELYFLPKIKCPACAEEHYGNGVMKVNLLTKSEVILTSPTDSAYRLNTTTDTGLDITINLHMHDIVPCVGSINLKYSEESRELVDIQSTNKTPITYNTDSMYNTLKYQTTEEFLDDDGVSVCPDCKYKYLSEPMYEVYCNPTDSAKDNTCYLRTGYFSESENGFNINDASILISHVDADDLEKPIQNEDTFIVDSDCESSFENFIRIHEQDPTAEW